jgi:hypothetical protein
MATIDERLQAHTNAGALVGTIQSAHTACTRAAAYLAAYQDGTSNPTGANGELKRQIDLLFDQADELTELATVLGKLKALVDDLDTHHAWVGGS